MRFRKRLLLYFMIVAAVPTVLFGIHFYVTSREALVKELCESNYKICCHLMDSIDSQFRQAGSLTDWICFDRSVAELLKKERGEVSSFDFHKQQVLEQLDNQFSYLPVTEYIPALFLLGDNGLDIRRGTNAQMISPKSFQDAWWFRESADNRGKAVWGDVYRQPWNPSESSQVIPFVRGIQDYNSDRVLGYLIILYDQRLISRQFESFEFTETEQVYCMDGKGTILYGTQEIEENRFSPAFFEELTEARDQNVNYREVEKNGISYMAVSAFSKLSGRGVVELIPITFVKQQKSVLLGTILIAAFLIVSVGVMMSLYLTANFTRPLERISAYVTEISQGHFGACLELRGDDEIYRLGENIRAMVEKINELMEEGLRREREKHNLRVQMLQQQINPHFLYNTLNSIQWMAAMQGAEGISHAARSLGTLLQYGLRDPMAFVELRRELSVLEEYIYIQNIRYKGKIIYKNQVTEEETLSCLVPKLILQPLAENAIFHGIEPKTGMGGIEVRAECERGLLYIRIKDDGVGMSAERMRILSDPESRPRSIGIANIHERLRILYGEKYGIEFQSEIGVYTEAVIRIPAQWSDQGGGEGESTACR